MTEYVETRKFPAAGVSVDYELDLRTTNKLQVDIRKRNLQRMGYYVRLVADEVDFWHHSSMRTVTVHSLYKHKKPDARKYYPLPGGFRI